MEKRKVSDELETKIRGEICNIDDSGISCEDVENNKHNDNEDRLDDALMDKQNKDDINMNEVSKVSDIVDRNAKDRGTNEETVNSSDKKSYASATRNVGWFETNKLVYVPTVFTEVGNEVVVFYKDLVEIGKECGVGRALKKLWIMVMWDPSLGINKVELTKIPVWVKLLEVPIEAWSTEEISAISSSVRRPLVMDNMTAYVCKNGTGRTEFARVLMEMEASKGFKEEVLDSTVTDKNKKNNDKIINNTNSFHVLIDLEDDNIQGINIEKEKNDLLNSIEGIVEDVLDDEYMAGSEMVAASFMLQILLDEHSAGKSIISSDMQDFINCVNNIEVEDVCWFGMHFTWIKSPSNPATSILKKLDRVMANEDFIAKYNQA
ncbi:RNA-directed DNA polymerase, eukaryota, reverse transcriptase zinc-binding domain protein [Tanacetum coccineum]